MWEAGPKGLGGAKIQELPLESFLEGHGGNGRGQNSAVRLEPWLIWKMVQGHADLRVAKYWKSKWTGWGVGETGWK